MGRQVRETEGHPHEQQEGPVDLRLERRTVEDLRGEQEAQADEREPGRIDAVPRLRDPSGQDDQGIRSVVTTASIEASWPAR
jgi:hypothetical protein